MNSNKKLNIVCVPGLGGHPSSFYNYRDLLSEHDFCFVSVENYNQALTDLEKFVLESEEKVVLFCNCFGANLALRVFKKYPEKISRLIITEPYFSELYFFTRLLVFIPMKLALWLLMAINKFVYRTINSETKESIDYNKLKNRNVFLQPLYDLRWQTFLNYFIKINDLFSFRLSRHKNNLKTLFIISRRALMEKIKREQLKKYFFNSSEIIIDGNHDAIISQQIKIANVIRNWLEG